MIRALERINPPAKIIVSSGLAANSGTARPEVLQQKAFIAKPYTAEQLLKTLRDVLTRPQGGRANNFSDRACTVFRSS